ncbi:sigma-70 family RNA polymerase sigma factor [Mucilaginibacter sp. HMF5004]|uniref:RNA polymerase sigma factor n=1 Tax=Mucilaginibacter rivuli TaxID=2857527 RepID=UPI001C5D6210|nr:sigma-70 family RNA polymerase sigma factor [Mucilaginibacter rivuli]MBW4889076.1 sigma-70 family RNA polymerase sigma factor [Mucilaginibacter rivuli]
MIFLKSANKPDHTDDEQLLHQYRQTGDMAVLARLYEKYMHLVYGVCLKYLKDEELSKDAVMQIFEELVVKVNRHEIKYFKSWLYMLSRNFCLMELRSGKKIQEQPLDEFMEFAEEMHPVNVYREDDMAALERCKQKLPKPQKICVDLFYTDEQCYKDIAAQTGYAINEVKSNIQNGKRNLKICLEKNREH